MRLLKDMSLAAVNAGLVTVLVGFTSSAVIVFEAAQALGASPTEIGSWMLALGIGMGITGLGLSLYYKTPVATAWSTSGAAMLSTSVSGISMNEAMGAFVMTGLLITLFGFSGWFERLIDKIPMSVAAGMLCGVLLRFGLNAFASLHTEFAMVLVTFATYLLARRLLPRYAVVSALLTGTAMAALQGRLHFEGVEWTMATPVFVPPMFTLRAFIGISLPLFVVTMASQNAPGTAVLRSSGYRIRVSPLIGWTGVFTVLLAPFGAYTLNLSTITAAICVGKEAHEDPERRYVAAVVASMLYVLVGIFGASVAAVFGAFPRELVFAIAGFALLGTLGNGLAQAMAVEREREAALVTFLLTASGVTLFGIGSAFWGLIAGVVVLLLARLNASSAAPLVAPKPLVVPKDAE